MKKLFLIVLGVVCALGSFAEGYTSQQRRLILDISNYLSQEGYQCESVDEGLKFKSNGGTYYVEVSKEDRSPMYVRLCRYVSYGLSVKKTDVKENLQSLNAKYGVKTVLDDRNAVISFEMYVSSASEFNYAFPTMLAEVQSIYKKVVQ